MQSHQSFMHGLASPRGIGLVVAAALLASVLAVSGLVPASASAAPATDVAPAATRAASCPPTISQGSTGYWVRVLQATLNGYPYYVDGPLLDVDGDFGPKTRAAVTSFQRYFGLGVDGIVGPQTWTWLGYCV